MHIQSKSDSDYSNNIFITQNSFSGTIESSCQLESSLDLGPDPFDSLERIFFKKLKRSESTNKVVRLVRRLKYRNAASLQASSLVGGGAIEGFHLSLYCAPTPERACSQATTLHSNTVFIRLKAAAFIKFLAFPMRRLFEGGVYFKIIFLKSLIIITVNHS